MPTVAMGGEEGNDMELKVTQYEIGDDGVAVVRLRRPGRGNSWTARMNAEYRWIMARLEHDAAARVIVVTGSGDQFCVGADHKALAHYTEGDHDYVASVRGAELAKPGQGVHPEFDHDLVWHWGIGKPIVAAINGACAGIAMALACFCDLRYAASGAKLTTATARLGLPAEYGLSWLLPRLVGVTHAADILLTGRIFRAEEALRMGLVNDVFPRESFNDTVMRIARSAAAEISPLSAAATKRQLYGELMERGIGRAVDASKELIGVMMKHPDYREGVAALRDRRAPSFPPAGHERVVLPAGSLPPYRSADGDR
ncbi:enoyl-CoA hydratase-related protein [Vineibacter terrae]|uniref:enoyl-CoA hydratase-related protein n=1 Tax=Vineibacter terrae TaxID=2586908 RepID=UPI002E2FEBAC|nr:enoyl-CoA hydratase-related protein [Vineibacter terrae]HEX2889632.1 enoyl-CoA hydratase-related protein [Vineibacter terrae]